MVEFATNLLNFLVSNTCFHAPLQTYMLTKACRVVFDEGARERSEEELRSEGGRDEEERYF